MPNYGYHLARAHGAAIRRLYSVGLPLIARRRITSSREVPFEVFSYSSERDLPEQVASIRSFLKFAGQPPRFTVVSDGTHSPRSVALLESIDPIVTVTQASDYVSPSSLPYLREHPTGKQLALIMSLPLDRPLLYIDADVLFFPGARELPDFQINAPAAYLPDCRLSADERLFRDEDEKENPVNTGVLFLRSKLDWSLGLKRFAELSGPPQFFTNQTITHLAMHASGAVPFDPAKYVLQLDDQFIYADAHAAKTIVLRHYVRPVRHKFWTTLWNA